MLGMVIPWIARDRIWLNADLSLVDTGKATTAEERGPLYSEPITFMWLGIGVPLWPALVRRASDNSALTEDELDAIEARKALREWGSGAL